MKRLFINEVTNMRDLGGYSTNDGKVTNYNKFIRSNFFDKLSEENENILLENNINTVIDLRNKKEVERKKHPLCNNRFNYYNVQLKGGKAPDDEKDVSNGYMDILEDYDNMKEVFSIILNNDNGIIFNCNAGKDRTGIVAMLLLLIANVNDDDIIADYQVSYTYLRKVIRNIHKNNPDLPAFLGGSKLEYMEETLEKFYKKYHSIYEYMNKLGFTNEQVETIKQRIVDNK